MKKRCIAAGLTIAVIVGLIHTPSANAAGNWTCTKGYICVYSNTNGVGFILPKNAGGAVCVNLNSTWNDHVGSIRLRADTTWALFEHHYCDGRNALLYPQTWGNMSTYWRTHGSSIARIH